LTGRSQLERRRFALDCNVIVVLEEEGEEEEEYVTKYPTF
jgi:hypothetical protein